MATENDGKSGGKMKFICKFNVKICYLSRSLKALELFVYFVRKSAICPTSGFLDWTESVKYAMKTNDFRNISIGGGSGYSSLHVPKIT